MSDKRVFCDCGEPLVYEVDMIIPNVKHKITKEGKVSERIMKGSYLLTNKGYRDGWGRLLCLKCENAYEANYSFKENRMLRGDLL